MSCTPNHILIELGESRRKEGRKIMKNECCHDHPDNGDLATQTPPQEEETDLRAINAKLLAALEGLLHECEILDSANIHIAGIKQARNAIREAND